MSAVTLSYEGRVADELPAPCASDRMPPLAIMIRPPGN